jgi:uncharacterized membrane protein YjjB (DUF3815 family)
LSVEGLGVGVEVAAGSAAEGVGTGAELLAHADRTLAVAMSVAAMGMTAP